MEILKEIKERKSVRKFTSQIVNDEQIEALMKAGMSAPSAVNKRPWCFYVIKDEDTRNKIINSMPYGKYNAPIIIIPCIMESHTLPLHAHDLAYCDLSAVTENILIEAVHLGLGTVWCAVYPDNRRIKALKEILNLSDDITPFSTIYVGYEDGNAPAKDKFDPSRIHII